MKKNGFTLIEMMVVMAIIAIITSIVLVSYRSNDKNNLLQLTAQQVANDLREVQNMALSSQKYNGEVPKGGFGISFNTNNLSYYIVFADEDEDGIYDSGEEMETINLPEGIELTSIGGAANPLDITFRPPDPTTYFKGGEWNYGYLKIGIEGTSVEKEIDVYSKGAIEINDP